MNELSLFIVNGSLKSVLLIPIFISMSYHLRSYHKILVLNFLINSKISRNHITKIIVIITSSTTTSNGVMAIARHASQHFPYFT